MALFLLYCNIFFLPAVIALGCYTRQKIVPNAAHTPSFVNYQLSKTSLKATKILPLISPVLPPSESLSLFQYLPDHSKKLEGERLYTLVEARNRANLNDHQALNFLVELSKEIENISIWVSEQLSPLGFLNEALSVPAFSSDIHELTIRFQRFQSDSIHGMFRFVSEQQSHLIQSYHFLSQFMQPIMQAPGLSQFTQPITQALFAIPPVFSLFTSTVISYLLVNALIPRHQASPPSRPYPTKKYDAHTARAYFDRRPALVILRALTIGSQSLQFGFALLLDHIQAKTVDNELQRGRELAGLLSRLGPTFIKVGQSLSIRTDLVSPSYVRGLEMLQDQVPAFDTVVAKRLLETEWGRPITAVLSDDLSAKPVAAASLGQVYRARLRESNEEVAIKVQRPDIMEEIALDMYLIREIGGIIKRLTKLNTDIIGTVDAWGIGFIDELNYMQEAANGEKFSELIIGTPLRDVVFAPTVIKEYTTESVLVSSWVDGDRLDRSDSKDISVICSIAMNTYLTMLLEFGLLHCDPHPGNLLRTPDGKLCILDWGMVTRLDSELQLTLIEHMAHLTSADYEELPRDLLLLGFVSEDKADIIDDSGVVEVLADIYGAWTAGGGAAAINVNEVIAQLQDLTAKKGNLFRIPPYFAYIAKSFSVLEGIGLSNDPKYSIINECLPYVSKRLLTDNDKMGPALSTFIFGSDKSKPDRIINYRRVEQLVEGFGEYTTSASGALLGKQNLSKPEILDDVAEQVLNLVFTEKETPFQQIFIEQLAKIVSSIGRVLLSQVREQSGLLPSGRTRIGVLLDPLGFWRTSPLVRANEKDLNTLETTKKLIALIQRQLRISGISFFDLSVLTPEESIELSLILAKKIWKKRYGVLQTSNLLAREMLQLTAQMLENGERDIRRLPKKTSLLDSSNTTILASIEVFPKNNNRLSVARKLLQDAQTQEKLDYKS